MNSPTLSAEIMDITVDQLTISLEIAAKLNLKAGGKGGDCAGKMLNSAVVTINRFREYLAQQIYECDCNHSGCVPLLWSKVSDENKTQWRDRAEEAVKRAFQSK